MNRITKKELLELEKVDWFEDVPLLDYIYIISSRKKHDSHYNLIYVIGENVDTGYKKILTEVSDVIDFKTIGLDYDDFSLDFPEYGVARLFTHKNELKFKVPYTYSSSFRLELVVDDKDLKIMNKWVS